MEMENKNLQMEILIKDNFKIIDLMDLAHIHGNMMMLHMKVVSKMDLDMVKENGHQDKLNIQEAIQKVLNRVMDNYIFQVVIFTKAISLRTKDKVMGKCFGQMVHFIKVNGKVVFKMERDKYIS